jgi:molybdenum cofactor cytidylyltransferase
MDAPVAPVGILLAAGQGRRFDPAGQRNKLLQPLADGEPVVAASARRLLAVAARVVAVVAPDDDGVGSVLAALGCDVTVCPDAGSGMAASLTHALRHALASGPAPRSWLVALGDMPYVDVLTLRALAAALAAGAGIAAPVVEGRRGNPVGFGAVHLDALLALRGDAGARHLLRMFPVTEVAVQDPGILRDIDVPDDLSGT